MNFNFSHIFPRKNIIPRKIHYCWVGDNKKSPLIERCLESWHRVMPDFEIIEWNETNIPSHLEYCKEGLNRGLWSKVSNFVRLWALFHEGGIYMDTDFEVLKSLTPLRKHTCFLGFQRKEKHIGWATNGIIGAHEGHPFLQKCMDKTLQIYMEKGEFILSPHVTTMILQEMGLKFYGFQTVGGVTIYPKEYFYPYSWFENFSPDCITNNTFAIHHWEGSWREK